MKSENEADKRNESTRNHDKQNGKKNGVERGRTQPVWIERQECRHCATQVIRDMSITG